MNPEPRVIHRLLAAFNLALVLRLARMVLNLGLVSLLGRYLGDEQIGRLFVSQGVVLVLMGVCELGFSRIPTREHVRHPADEAEIAGAAFYARSTAGLLCFAGLCGIAWTLGWEDRWYLGLFGLVLLSNGCVEISAVLTARNRLKEVVWCQFSGFLLSAALTLGGLLMRAPALWFAAAFAAEQWGLHLMIWLRYRKSGGRIAAWRFVPRRAVVFLQESWQELLSALMLLMLMRVDSMILKATGGDAAAGQYSAAVRISEIPMFIPLVLASIILPRLVELREAERGRFQRRLGDYLALSFCGSALVAALQCLLAPVTVAVLWGPAFAQSAEVLRWHAWVVMPYALNIARGQFLTIEKKLWVNTVSLALSLIAQIALCQWWIPHWGARGAAMAVLAGWGVGWLVSSLCFQAGRRFVATQWEGLRRLPEMARELISIARVRPRLAA